MNYYKLPYVEIDTFGKKKFCEMRVKQLLLNEERPSYAFFPPR